MQWGKTSFPVVTHTSSHFLSNILKYEFKAPYLLFLGLDRFSSLLCLIYRCSIISVVLVSILLKNNHCDRSLTTIWYWGWKKNNLHTTCWSCHVYLDFPDSALSALLIFSTFTWGFVSLHVSMVTTHTLPRTLPYHVGPLQYIICCKVVSTWYDISQVYIDIFKQYPFA